MQVIFSTCYWDGESYKQGRFISLTKMIGAFIVCLIFFLGFRAIGTSNEKRWPADTMWKISKEDGAYILWVALIIAITRAIVSAF